MYKKFIAILLFFLITACNNNSIIGTSFTIYLENDHTLTFPNNYHGGNFVGDDTYGFQVRRNDEKAVFSIEIDPGNPHGLVFLEDPIPEVFSNYNNRVFVNLEYGNKGIFYFKETESTFRDIVGTFFLQNSDGDYEEAIHVSYASELQDEILEILSTAK